MPARLRRRLPAAATAVALTVLFALAVAPGAAHGATAGGLKQLTGSKGCIADDSSPPTGCEGVRAMDDIGDLALSPDGKNVYVVSVARDAIVVFDRNASSGELTQKSGVLGCLTSNGTVATQDSCNLLADTLYLDGPRGITVSPDGKSVYAVTDSGRLTGFDRADDGSLTFNQASNYIGPNVGGLVDVEVSPDGASIYLGGQAGGGNLAIYNRNRTEGSTLGDITFRTCWANTTCGQAPPNTTSVQDIEVSPDGKSVLVASEVCCNWNVSNWDRTTTDGASLGSLAPPSAPADCTTGNSGFASCQFKSGQVYPRGIEFGGDGRIFVAGFATILSIERDSNSNALSPGVGNCFQYPNAGYPGCGNLGTAFGDFYPAKDVAVTQDGQNVYLATESSTPHIFSLARSGGTLSTLANPLGCTNPAGESGCATLVGGEPLRHVEAAPDDGHVYAVSDNRLYSFTRDKPPTCQPITASTKFNTSVAIKLNWNS